MRTFRYHLRSRGNADAARRFKQVANKVTLLIGRPDSRPMRDEQSLTSSEATHRDRPNQPSHRSVKVPYRYLRT